MRIFVAGGTGVVGRRLVPLLVSAGHQVTATTRSPGKRKLLQHIGADPVLMDALDADAVTQAVANAEPEVIVHQMTALSGAPDMRHFDRWFRTTNALRTRGTEHLLAAARATGVRRFVAQSYTGWTHGGLGEGVTTEEDPLVSDPPRQQRETLAAIRFLERTVTDSPVEGLVLRYGNLYGPGASEPLVELVRERKVPVVGGGAGVWSWLHVEDAAAAAAIAVERGRPGIYNVVDDEPAPVAEWLPYLAQQVGAPAPLHVPAWLGRLLAGAVPVSMMTQSRGSSNAKAKRELGWYPAWRSWREGFRDGLTDADGPGRPTARQASS